MFFLNAPHDIYRRLAGMYSDRLLLYQLPISSSITERGVRQCLGARHSNRAAVHAVFALITPSILSNPQEDRVSSLRLTEVGVESLSEVL